MNSPIKHIPNTYFVELREDYITLCKALPKREKRNSSAHCKALILAVMEHWTNYLVIRRKSLYVNLSYPQWIKSMFGMFGRNCIADSLADLVDDNLLIREKHNIGGRDSYKYLLNLAEVNKQLAETATLIETETLDDESLAQYEALEEDEQPSLKPQSVKTRSKINYADYIQSPEWSKRRQKALRFAGFKCQVCNSAEGLNVHHRTYERLGHEHMGDLTVLCKNCHEIFHNNGELASNDEADHGR